MGTSASAAPRLDLAVDPAFDQLTDNLIDAEIHRHDCERDLEWAHHRLLRAIVREKLVEEALDRAQRALRN